MVSKGMFRLNHTIYLSGVRMSNLSKREGDSKKQSTITEMFANQKRSPRKHKIPVDISDVDVIPAKRPRIEGKEPATSKARAVVYLVQNQQKQSPANGDALSVIDNIAEDSLETERQSEVDSADSEATDIYWQPKDYGNNTSRYETVTSTAHNRSESLEVTPPPDPMEHLDSRSISSDEYFEKPVRMTFGGTLGTKARDTPTTKALNRAQGSEPISCPVCAREFKSRNMAHITSHIERCLEAANKQVNNNQESRNENNSYEEEVQELFEDESDELFSSRESQIILSQEVEEKEEEDVMELGDDSTEKAIEEDEVSECTEVIGENKMTKEGSEGSEDSEELKNAESPIQDPEAAVTMERDEQSEVTNVRETPDSSENIVNTVSEEVISKAAKSTCATESVQEVQMDNNKQKDTDVTKQKFQDDKVNENGIQNGKVKENGLPEDEVNENVLHQPVTTDMICPLCNIVRLSDLRLFNLHVDKCLNKEEISAKDVSETDTIPETETSDTRTSSGIGKASSAKASSAGKEDSVISYLKNITPRRPLRTGTHKSCSKSPESRSSTKTLSGSGASSSVPVRDTVTHRATHTCVTKVSIPEVGIFFQKLSVLLGIIINIV